MQTPTLARLVRLLGKLPSVGEKTALRYALHLHRSDPALATSLSEALSVLHQRVRQCEECFGLAEPEEGEAPRCSICTDPKRKADLLCVVARVQDVMAIERTRAMPGRYFVLGRLLSPLEGIHAEDLPIEPLIAKIRSGAIREVILATPPSVDGEATALLIRRELDPLEVSISRIVSGVPHGGDLELADPITMGRALSGRQKY